MERKWRITTLIENNEDNHKVLACEHGLSLLIEGRRTKTNTGIRVLLDTGDSGAFADNAVRMGVDLSGLDAVILSHAHYDHAGGLLRLIREYGPPKKLYLGKGFFKKSFYIEKDGRLKYIGIRFDRRMLTDLGVSIIEIDEDQLEAAPGLILHRNFPPADSPEAPDDHFVFQRENTDCFEGRCMDSMQYYPDTFSEETVVTLSAGNGLVVVAGCAHPGIINIIDTIEKRTGRKITGVIGGTHLMDAGSDRVQATIDSFLEHDLSLVAVSHCTGKKNLPLLREAFKDRFVLNNTGNIILI